MSRRTARRLFPWLLFAWLCLAVGPASASETLQDGPASAVLTGGKKEGERLGLRLSDTLRLTLSVRGGPTLEVETPEKLTTAEVWNARVLGPATTTAGENGQVRWQQTFRLDPLQKGEHTLQLQPLRYREDGGTWQETKWKPIPVTVTSDITRAEVGEARDITSIEEPPPQPSWLPWLLPAVLVPLAGVLVFLVWLLYQRRSRQALPVPPEQTALSEIDRAASMSLATPQEVERYHTFLSSVVRHYLEERFRLPASRRTTPEFFEAIREGPQLTAEQQSLLRDFLQRCDLGKFAPVTPSAEVCWTTADLARRFVQQTATTVLHN